jgi:hypothetical protein
VNFRKIFALLSTILIITGLTPFTTMAQVNGPQAPSAPGVVYFPMIVRETQVFEASNTRIVNHDSISKFDQIPDSFIASASQLHILFRHNSVGWYMSRGLDCLMNKVQPRPSDCDSGLNPSQIVYNSKYNRNNFQFEFNGDFCYNQFPGWYDVVACFVSRFDALSSQLNGGSFKFGYTQTTADLATLFFNPIHNDRNTSINDLTALEARHPDKKIFYTTSAIPQAAFVDAENYNVEMRKYAISNNKYFFDIADIESHHQDGSPCINNGVESLCPEYTFDGGHPNALGMQRLAKAWWVMMARLAGWSG